MVQRWIERVLVHGEGDSFGRPVRLDPFQTYILNRLYEYDPDTGRRLYNRALVVMPKGNAKTELAAMIGLAELAGPVAPLSPNIPVSAASFEQADRLYGAARTMVNEGGLRPYIDCFDTEMLLKDAPGRMYRVAAVAGTNDGSLPTVHIGDELHEWVGGRERVYVVIGNSLKKRRAGLQLGISTAGDDQDTLLGRLWEHGRKVATGEISDPRFLFICWTAADHWDLAQEDQLREALLEANPAAGSFLSLDNLMDRYHEVEEYEFKRYHLNVWVSAPDSWISSGRWQARAVHRDPPPAGDRIFVGFDGSYSRDCTSLVGCTPDGYLFHIRTWERGNRDSEWTVPRTEVDAVVAQTMQRWNATLVCDPPGWHEEIENWEAEYGERVVRFETNVPARMGPACDRFFAAVTNETLTHDGDPTLARHVGHCRTRETRFGRVITKDAKDSPRKIDSAVAAVVAFDSSTAMASVWDDPEHDVIWLE